MMKRLFLPVVCSFCAAALVLLPSCGKENKVKESDERIESPSQIVYERESESGYQLSFELDEYDSITGTWNDERVNMDSYWSSSVSSDWIESVNRLKKTIRESGIFEMKQQKKNTSTPKAFRHLEISLDGKEFNMTIAEGDDIPIPFMRVEFAIRELFLESIPRKDDLKYHETLFKLEK